MDCGPFASNSRQMGWDEGGAVVWTAQSRPWAPSPVMPHARVASVPHPVQFIAVLPPLQFSWFVNATTRFQSASAVYCISTISCVPSGRAEKKQGQLFFPRWESSGPREAKLVIAHDTYPAAYNMCQQFTISLCRRDCMRSFIKIIVTVSTEISPTVCDTHSTSKRNQWW